MKRISKKDLLTRYALGQCSEEESRWVEKWYLQQEDEGPVPLTRSDFQEDIKEIYATISANERGTKRRYAWAVAAALIGVCLSVGIIIHVNKEEAPSVARIVPDIPPSQNATTIRLTNGSLVAVDQMTIGEIIHNEYATIFKSEKGQIEYIDTKISGDNLNYNELTTSEGGQYSVVLSDGTKVWLNATSTLRYPVRFDDQERVVELTGEAYFEVAKQEVPFYVKTEKQEIRVLGTSFNVKAYGDEDESRTTLLEGSVTILAHPLKDGANSVELLLTPGDQAVLRLNKESTVEKVDAERSIAWRSGLFSFQNEDLQSIMREFSRWYGVEVKFEGDVPATKLSGQVYRNVNASQALSVLEYFDLKFRIIENKGVSKIEISEK